MSAIKPQCVYIAGFHRSDVFHGIWKLCRNNLLPPEVKVHHHSSIDDTTLHISHLNVWQRFINLESFDSMWDHKEEKLETIDWYRNSKKSVQWLNRSANHNGSLVGSSWYFFLIPFSICTHNGIGPVYAGAYSLLYLKKQFISGVQFHFFSFFLNYVLIFPFYAPGGCLPKFFL